MNVYLHGQSKQMLELCEPESCGVFFDDEQGMYVGWKVDDKGVLDVVEGETFDEVWDWVRVL